MKNYIQNVKGVLFRKLELKLEILTGLSFGVY